MIWGLLALTVFIWLAAIFYIVKGWGESGVATSPGIKRPQPIPKAEEEPVKEEKAEEIEIPIGEPPHEEIQPTPRIDLEVFYEEFGKVNIVEFPAEYIDRESVKGLSGNKINIVEFAKKCYREIDFQCIDLIMVKEEKERTYKVNIFDLISDHYASTDEGFINFFAQLKERFAQEIESVGGHPDITPENKRALVGRYEGLPQLLVWNKKELFLTKVMSKDGTLDKELDFFKEFVIQRKLFKARIFKVTERQEKKVPPAAPKVTKTHFTREESNFLEENKDKFTNEELAEKLGRSVDSIAHKLSRLGIARESYEWTKEKDAFLEKNITKLSYRKLAERLGTTIPSVRARCKKINIKK